MQAHDTNVMSISVPTTTAKEAFLKESKQGILLITAI